MRLVLALPSHLSSTWIEHGPHQIAMRDVPGMIVASELLPLPDDVPAWVRDVQHADRPAGSTVHAEALVERETERGWRYRIASARILLDDRVVAVRIGAFYRFFEYVGSAVITFSTDQVDDRALAARVEETVEIFATARPDFSSQVAGLHLLWA